MLNVFCLKLNLLRILGLFRMAKNKFTLIELLVVIAIVAILTSLLLPALSLAREKSKIAVCKSNMKQISYAMVMYHDDNNGYYPFSDNQNSSGPPGQYSWDDLLSSYDGREIRDTAALQNQVLLKSLGYNSDLYSCPSDTLQRTHWIGNAKILPASYALPIRYFGANWVLTNWARGITSIKPSKTKNINNLNSPSTTLTMVELSATNRIVGRGEGSFVAINTYKNAQTPHEKYGKDNYLMADGSVKTMTLFGTLAKDGGGSGTPNDIIDTMWDSEK